MNINLSSNVKESTFSAIITRADGTIEELGVISYYNSNIIKRWLWKIKQYFKIGY